MTVAVRPLRSRWVWVAALLGAGALLAWPLPAVRLDWQPARFGAEPWRAVSAAWVHWSALHLAANLVGVALVGALGVTAGLPPRAALAWLLAWPPTQTALLLQPALAHYGGASGVLHAGVAVAAVWLLRHARGRRRAIGGCIAIGLAAKVLLERPWGAPLRASAGWDIAVAPLAHAAGAVAGAVLALCLSVCTAGARRRRAADSAIGERG